MFIGLPTDVNSRSIKLLVVFKLLLRVLAFLHHPQEA